VIEFDELELTVPKFALVKNAANHLHLCKLALFKDAVIILDIFHEVILIG
jgi:hypothetical protein